MSSPSVKGAEYGWWVESGCVRGVVEVLGEGGQEVVLNHDQELLVPISVDPDPSALVIVGTEIMQDLQVLSLGVPGHFHHGQIVLIIHEESPHLVPALHQVPSHLDASLIYFLPSCRFVTDHFAVEELP